MRPKHLSKKYYGYEVIEMIQHELVDIALTHFECQSNRIRFIASITDIIVHCKRPHRLQFYIDLADWYARGHP